MLYSQVNYLGSFLPFSQVHHLSFSKPIEKFVNGNLKISNCRLYTEVKNGGLGLMRMADFLNCQKCGWLPLTRNIKEKWKFDFLVGCGGEMGSAHESQFPTNTILKSFAKSVECLRNIHFKKDQNFLEARIFNNILTPISLRPFKIIDGTFLEHENFKKLKIFLRGISLFHAIHSTYT